MDIVSNTFVRKKINYLFIYLFKFHVCLLCNKISKTIIKIHLRTFFFVEFDFYILMFREFFVWKIKSVCLFYFIFTCIKNCFVKVFFIQFFIILFFWVLWLLLELYLSASVVKTMFHYRFIIIIIVNIIIIISFKC